MLIGRLAVAGSLRPENPSKPILATSCNVVSICKPYLFAISFVAQCETARQLAGLLVVLSLSAIAAAACPQFLSNCGGGVGVGVGGGASRVMTC